MEALQTGRFADAADLAGEGTDDVSAMLLGALARAALGEAEAAAPLLLAVARARPGLAHPCREFAVLLPDRPDLVAAQFRACRKRAPEDLKLAYAYADFLQDSGRHAAAAAVLLRLIRSHPEFGPAKNLFGMALIELGDLAGAITAFRSAIALDPADAAAWSNLGMALKTEGWFAEAAAAHDRAVALAPSDARLRLNRAVAALRAGRMAQAWPDYESRLQLSGRLRLPHARLLPALAELGDLHGRTVFAWHAEGFGDTLQFARYLPLLAERGARVIAQVPNELLRLLCTLPGAVEVIGPQAPVPAHDWHAPFSSLPRAFATTLETIPAAVPYLRADPAEAAAWAAILPAAGGLRVGLAWAGQSRPWLPGFTTVDRRRSTDLVTLAPLGEVAGIHLVSLQKGPAAAQARHPPPGLALTDPMAKVTDFAATAAIMATLDVVVSVDTSVAHLAGALGKPVLMLDRYDACWRWLAGRDDSPWYPTLRIYRQPRMGDWAPAVERVVEDLNRRAAPA
jgi:Flp pilus assembly protein TadD